MSANQYLLEAQVRHQIFLLRRGAGISKELVPELVRMLKKVAGEVAVTPDAQLRQAAFIQEIQLLLETSLTAFSDDVLQESLELAEYETGFQQRLLSGAATVDFAAPALAQVAQAVEFNPSVGDPETGNRISIRQSLDQFNAKKTDQLLGVIRDGIVQQKTNSEISKDLLELEPLLGRQANTLVRTSAISASNEAKREVYSENEDLLKGERYVATLDLKTTDTCAKFDSQIFPVGQGPMPALHFGCRSLRVPELKDEYQIPGFDGERPEKGADGPGTTSTRTTFNSFLKRQPASFQKEYFSKFPDGDERYKLFSQGSLSISKFTDANGATLTLDELRALEPLAFERAGLD